ncbi:MAG: LysM peptidoglycan-binding domain-containing protein [Bacteroidota bacterium]
MSGILNKMKIMAFADCDFSIPEGVFVAQVNPDSYSLNYTVEYDESQAQGTSGRNARMHRKGPGKLKLDFLFDSTGAVPSSLGVQNLSKELGVEADLILFKKFLIGFNSETHRTRFLILHWGTLLFKCVLINLDIKFTLFQPNGVPIRAVASATFKGSIPDLLREAKEKFNSPDLTHYREVRQSDTLFNLCEEIYGDPSLYIKIAEINNLIDFRQLKVGTKLYFPPLQRQNG